MTYPNSKPPGSPWCWGPAAKYQDGDKECMQCAFRDSCRQVVMSYLTAPKPPTPPPLPLAPVPKPVPSYTAPVSPVYTPPPVSPLQSPSLYRPNPQTPSSPYAITPAPPTVPQPYQPVPAPPVYPYQQPPPSPTYQYQQPAPQMGFPILDYQNPNPFAAMYRPGVQQPPYYFALHPGETIKERLAKNITLRMAESAFFELGTFFRHWTWPPKPEKK